MAKQIKAIKCPQCGSSSHTKVSEDYYICNSCGAEYFLDNDDINIHVQHQYRGSNVPSSRILKIIGVSLVAILLIILLVNACGSLFRSSSKKSENNTSQSSTNKVDKKENVFSDLFRYSYVFENSSKDIIVLSLVERKNRDSSLKDPRDGCYFIFTNLLSGNIIEEEKLNISEFKSKDSKTFFNGKTYLLINDRILYEINENDMSLTDVSESILHGHKEFASGIAKIHLEENELSLKTNLGKEYYYYPIVDKIYTRFLDLYYAGSGFRSLLPGAKDVTYYQFSNESVDYPDEPIQLLKIVYKSNSGGPERTSEPRWFKDFGDSYTRYTKRLFTVESRIVSYKDLTPDRFYFEAAVKYYDDKVIIIKYRPTVAEDAPVILQCLDAETCEIKWTLNLDKETNFSDSLTKTSKGYVAEKDYDYDHFLLISEDGKIDKNIELKNERVMD